MAKATALKLDSASVEDLEKVKDYFGLHNKAEVLRLCIKTTRRHFRIDEGNTLHEESGPGGNRTRAENPQTWNSPGDIDATGRFLTGSDSFVGSEPFIGVAGVGG